MNVDLRDYVDRVVNDLRVDLVDRIKHVETVARDAATALGTLLHGFPATYATKKELEHVRQTADNLQIHLIGRARFETFETQINEQLNELSQSQGRASGMRTVIIAVAVIAATTIIALLATLQNTVSSNEDRVTKLEHETIVIQDQLMSIQALDRFFCRTRTPKLPGC